MSDGTNETKYQLSFNRFVTVSKFRHQVRVDIREFYLTDGQERKPGKKGISLTRQEWNKLKAMIDDIDQAVEDHDKVSD